MMLEILRKDTSANTSLQHLVDTNLPELRLTYGDGFPILQRLLSLNSWIGFDAAMSAYLLSHLQLTLAHQALEYGPADGALGESIGHHVPSVNPEQCTNGGTFKPIPHGLEM